MIEDAVYDAAIAALARAGGYLCTPVEKYQIEKALWLNGKLNRNLIARSTEVLAPAFGLPETARNSKFFMVEETRVGKQAPFSGEKLCLVLTVYRAKDFAAAKERVREILDFQGRGHSCGLSCCALSSREGPRFRRSAGREGSATARHPSACSIASLLR